jgi:hypothetical protein
MGSQPENLPSWHDWDSCHVFSARESNYINSGMSKVRKSVLKNSLDRASILGFCKDRKTSENAVFKAAWCIVINAYAGAVDVCTAVKMLQKETLLRCRLDPEQTAKDLFSAMEEIDLGTVGNDEEANILARSSGLFQTKLSICDPEPCKVCRSPT